MSRGVRVAASAAAMWLAVFVVVPVVVLLTGNVRVNDFSRVLTSDVTWKVVWFSTWQSILSTGATFVLAMPVTWLIGRYHFLGRRALRAVTTIGFLLPSVVVAAAFLAVLPRSLHYSVFAVVLAHAYFNLAVIVRVVGARLESLDSRLDEAAVSLGASPARTAATITWPLIRGAAASAAAVTFLFSFTSYAVVRVLGGPGRNTIESDIALRAFGIGDVSGASVLALLQAVVIVCVVSLLRRAAGREATLLRTAARLTPMPPRVRWVALLVSFVTVAFVATPLLAVFWRSIHVGDAVTLEAWSTVVEESLLGSIMSSLRTAVVTALLGMALAGAASLAIVRSATLGRTLDTFTVLPLAVSPVTLGLGFVVTFDQSWYDWRGMWWFVATAHAVVAFPLIVRVLVPAWRAIPPRLSEAATALGAGEVRRLVDIDLRLLRRAFAAGLGLAVAVSLGEFGAASLLSRQGAETMPVAIARLLERTGDLVRAQAFVLSSLLVVLCAATLLVVEISLGRQRDVAHH
ncbi:MAG: ABC transporter permease [Actinomycetota bacterium]